MVNSIYNGWRMEDVWMDKVTAQRSSRRRSRSIIEMALGFPRATGPWGKGQGDDEKETVLQSPMRYLSTRDARPRPATYSFEDVLLAGPRRGWRALYVPRGAAGGSTSDELARLPLRRACGADRRIVCRRRLWPRRAAAPLRGRLCRVSPPGGDATRPAPMSGSGCWSCFTGRPSPSRIWRCNFWGSFSTRCAGAARQTGHHRRRHLGRYRLGGDRGVPRPREYRYLHSLSAGPHLRRATPADDHGRRRQRTRSR